MFRTRASKVRQRFFTLLVILGMLCSASGLLPGILALIGQIDSDHSVFVSSSGEELEVRFHHSHADADHDAGDETLSVTDASAPHEDHVIRFAAPSHLLAQRSYLVTSHQFVPCPAMMEAEQSAPILHRYLTVPHARPPPSGILHRYLSSVVLLV